jgi:ligand-binding sensor domain-containing protein
VFRSVVPCACRNSGNPECLEDHQGRLWIASRYNGFFRLAADGSRDSLRVVEAYDVADGLPTGWVSSVWESSDRRFWVATIAGLLELLPHGGRAPLRHGQRDLYRPALPTLAGIVTGGTHAR